MGDNNNKEEGWQSYVPTDEDEEEISREELRNLLSWFGLDLPASMEDITGVATQLKETLAQLEYLEATGLEGFPGLKQVTAMIREKARLLSGKLYSYASEKFGAQGTTAVTAVLRPALPSVAKLPTAEEFLGDYDQAFSTYIEGMRQSGALSKQEAEFAYSSMRPQFFQKYTSKLGEFAQSGQSPFAMKEISREERGVGPATEAGKALEAALGVGVKVPTTITGTAQEVSAKAQALGEGIPREFTTVARVAPLDFLRTAMTPESIKIAYAGSQEGAGRGVRTAPPGYTSTPRRI